MEWIVITPSAWMNSHGHGINYCWDGHRLDSREEAIAHGAEETGSDDFNVASLEGEKLTGFFYMEEDMNDPEGMKKVAEQNDFEL